MQASLSRIVICMLMKATDVVYEPQDFMAKLAALVPAPRVHLTRFHGILAPAAKMAALDRSQTAECRIGCFIGRSIFRTGICTRYQRSDRCQSHHKERGSAPQLCVGLSHDQSFPIGRFAVRALRKPARILASIHPPDTPQKILNCLGLPSRAPPLASAVPDFSQMDSF